MRLRSSHRLRGIVVLASACTRLQSFRDFADAILYRCSQNADPDRTKNRKRGIKYVCTTILTVLDRTDKYPARYVVHNAHSALRGLWSVVCERRETEGDPATYVCTGVRDDNRLVTVVPFVVPVMVLVLSGMGDVGRAWCETGSACGAAGGLCDYDYDSVTATTW
ncbi:hypothetical protein K466DRAFT_364526 [Polyporus arcularius HHB13444]|uniref:Uncharacterized protein n=1 Tax=Polyporus arcularius HHB13444 TaxID=1314778 RepID=A0A5C3NTJ5_9APHY|nr:hypothetical protein K466DRAFT_364526 [Polyporus arcularius HHB13444]